MPQFKTISRIPAQHVKSLVWEGDNLVDWAGGGVRFRLRGESDSRIVNYAYRFDAACPSPSGKYVAIYERLGTKGLILRGGKVVREINRSFYHADAYEYPITFARLKSGQEVLIHAPDEYNKLEIDDAETGERLTASKDRQPFDFFHSRLAIDQESKLLLSAGWVWHPFDALCVYDIEAALADPTTLDRSGLFPAHPTEISSAAFLDNEHLVIATNDESFTDDEYEENELRPNTLTVWNIPQARIVTRADVPDPVGTLMPLTETHVVGFYDHPKIFGLRSGKVQARMENVSSGKQTSSIIRGLERFPTIAIDIKSKRFAIATEREVVVTKVLL